MTRIPIAVVRCCAAALLAIAPAGAQRALPLDDAALAAALDAWRSELSAGSLALDTRVGSDRGTRSPYRDLLGPGGALHDRTVDGLTHLGALRVLLDAAASAESPALVAAVLDLAAVGIDRGAIGDPVLLRVSEAADWTAARLSAHQALDSVASIARGETDAPLPRQVAALHALGRRAALHASAIARLGDSDPRIRLAATEALGQMRERLALGALGRALRTESHPVVAQALVGAIDRTLRRHAGGIGEDDLLQAVTCALRRLGRVAWRADLGIVALLERFPTRDAIPALIDVLDDETWGHDAITDTVNASASPLLKDRAWQALRRTTGAILPPDAARWREFWRAERDRIEIRSGVRDAQRIVTSSQFYGIPVVGGEVAFLIDCSNSMRAEVVGAQDGGARGRTRLDAARQQLLRAVQAMPASSRYHVLTFSAVVTRWNETPVPPGPDSQRQLTECVARFDYENGTDVHAALMAVLDRDDVAFGAPASNPIDEVFLLSDGEPVSGAVTDAELLLRVVRAVNRYQRVRIHTVFAGDGAGTGADLMRRIAEQNDGVFVRT